MKINPSTANSFIDKELLQAPRARKVDEPIAPPLTSSHSLQNTPTSTGEQAAG
jgi:hypothetical protein